MNTVVVELRNAQDVLVARRTGRELLRKLGFGLADQTRFATAISELARNAVDHGGGGICTISDVSGDGVDRVRASIEDSGPGIADTRNALRDGVSSGNGLGAGLPGARRLVHKFELSSQPGHTRVVIEMIKPSLGAGRGRRGHPSTP